jgi:predicted aldo/keto reductase-like oxidoreductase
LPCPQDIDIALMNKYLDEATFNFTEKLKKDYLHTVPNASDCIECGACIERCPFNIDAMEKMKTISDMFSMEKSA